MSSPSFLWSLRSSLKAGVSMIGCQRAAHVVYHATRAGSVTLEDLDRTLVRNAVWLALHFVPV